MSKVFLLAAGFSILSTAAMSATAEPAVINADDAIPALRRSIDDGAQTPALKQADFSNRWTGAYAGLNVSYAMLSDSAPAKGKGFVYGGFAGYNIAVMGNVVAGIEGGFTQMGIEFDDGSGVKAANSLSARIRGGYAADGFFVYGLIGAENAMATAGFAPGVKFKDTALSLGAGVDVAVTDKVAIGVEYSRTFYRQFDYPTFPIPVDVTMQKVQMRLSYKFN